MAANTTSYKTDKLRIGARASQLKAAGTVLGLGGLALTLILGYLKNDGMSMFLHSYLVGFTFWLSVACGALWFILIQHLTQATWSITVRRTAELLTAPFPMLLVLSLVIVLPILLGNDSLYLWSNHEVAQSDHLIHDKGRWFAGWAFSFRIVFYMVIMTGMARYFYVKSLAQDGGKNPELTGVMRKWSAPAMIVFALTLAFLGFDLLMSLEPRWFSTMFGVYYFAGCGIAFYALLSLVPMLWQRMGLAKRSITVEHYHDSGKMLFAFVFFWAYIAFSQFMLIWYANIPEETAYFRHRIFGDWQIVAIVLLVFHFAIPFVILMSRHTKRKMLPLAVFSLWMLVMHFIDLYWVVMPSYGNPMNPEEAIGPSLTSLIMSMSATIGIGGLFAAAVASAASKVNIIPNGDPRLSESVAFENQ